jgi:hypothetical protein
LRRQLVSIPRCDPESVVWKTFKLPDFDTALDRCLEYVLGDSEKAGELFRRIRDTFVGADEAGVLAGQGEKIDPNGALFE